MNLADRIKRYEKSCSGKLLPRTPILIRIDGKAFHTYTRGMKKPFDKKLIDAMLYAGEMTARQMMGFKIGYHQSDEFTFLLTDYDKHETQPWFGGKKQKIISVSASFFTAYFNQRMNIDKLAFFDSRVFNCPKDDVANVFVWRQQDWTRNSIEMFARSHFSHNQLHKKNQSQMHEMLHRIGENWADLSSVCKNGTFITKDGQRIHKKLSYDDIQSIIESQF